MSQSLRSRLLLLGKFLDIPSLKLAGDSARPYCRAK